MEEEARKCAEQQAKRNAEAEEEDEEDAVLVHPDEPRTPTTPRYNLRARRV